MFLRIGALRLGMHCRLFVAHRRATSRRLRFLGALLFEHLFVAIFAARYQVLSIARMRS